jgi:hypothetical protein
MGFVEDEEKVFAEGMKANSEVISKRNRKNRKILFVLLLLVLGGGVFVINGYLGGRNADDLYTNDPGMKRHIVESWIEVGFVVSYDIPSSTCMFNEDRWNKYSQEDKKAVTLLLDSYYANVQAAGHSGITLTGTNTNAVLATSGPSGVVLR